MTNLIGRTWLAPAGLLVGLMLLTLHARVAAADDEDKETREMKRWRRIYEIQMGGKDENYVSFEMFRRGYGPHRHSAQHALRSQFVKGAGGPGKKIRNFEQFLEAKRHQPFPHEPEQKALESTSTFNGALLWPENNGIVDIFQYEDTYEVIVTPYVPEWEPEEPEPPTYFYFAKKYNTDPTYEDPLDGNDDPIEGVVPVENDLGVELTGTVEEDNHSRTLDDLEEQHQWLRVWERGREWDDENAEWGDWVGDWVSVKIIYIGHTQE